MTAQLAKDPFNVIIAGVGGQGNLMASRLIANMLSLHGYYVTIGESFGMSQRGGSVMSHLRISKGQAWSPQIPKGKADFIISLEPTEAMRMVAEYGSKEVKVVTNDYPLHPAGVIAGDLEYPDPSTIKAFLNNYTAENHIVNATEEALKLGNWIFTNIIVVGAAMGMNLLPVTRDDFKTIMSQRIKEHLVEVNMKAYDLGVSMVQTKH